MADPSGATRDLSAALDRLTACRASDRDFLTASEVVLTEMAKLQHLDPGASDDLAKLYQKLTQEFLYADKCAELRSPTFVGKTMSKTSKY